MTEYCQEHLDLELDDYLMDLLLDLDDLNEKVVNNDTNTIVTNKKPLNSNHNSFYRTVKDRIESMHEMNISWDSMLSQLMNTRISSQNQNRIDNHETTCSSITTDEISVNKKRRLEKEENWFHDNTPSLRSQHNIFEDMRILQFPNLFYSAVNEGDTKKLTVISNQHIHPQCTIDVDWPEYRLTKFGGDILPHYYESLIASHPDGVISIRNVSGWRDEKDGLFKMKCTLRFCGTRVYGATTSDHFGRHRSLLKMMNRQKLSETEWKHYRQLEQEVMHRGKNPIIFTKIQLTMIVDQISNRIKHFLVKSYISSFRLTSV